MVLEYLSDNAFRMDFLRFESLGKVLKSVKSLNPYVSITYNLDENYFAFSRIFMRLFSISSPENLRLLSDAIASKDVGLAKLIKFSPSFW